ncbi:MAG: hypothetical protein K9J38_11625 [Polynucleobacter sp.]|nr:hypothetical protein [Polynucleobacter sp.]
MLIERLLASITFHYDEARLEYLQKVCLQIPSLGFDYKVLIVTNAKDDSAHQKIRDQLGHCSNFEIVSYPVMGHPFFLTWGHLPMFKRYHESDPSYSHFMYLEDDIQVTARNVNYWLRGRHELANYRLYPSFVRYEINYTNDNWVATDITKPLKLKTLPKISVTPEYIFINSPQPYQGMYIMDRPMMYEYFNSVACSPDFGDWGIREKATQGLTFLNVPKSFLSRNLIGYNLSQKAIDPDALIEHLPGNYANNPESQFGKLHLENLITS